MASTLEVLKNLVREVTHIEPLPPLWLHRAWQTALAEADTTTMSHIARHPHTPRELLEEIAATKTDASVRAALAGRPDNAPEWVAAYVAAQRNASVTAAAVAASPACPVVLAAAFEQLERRVTKPVVLALWTERTAGALTSRQAAQLILAMDQVRDKDLCGGSPFVTAPAALVALIARLDADAASDILEVPHLYAWLRVELVRRLRVRLRPAAIRQCWEERADIVDALRSRGMREMYLVDLVTLPGAHETLRGLVQETSLEAHAEKPAEEPAAALPATPEEAIAVKGELHWKWLAHSASATLAAAAVHGLVTAATSRGPGSGFYLYVPSHDRVTPAAVVALAMRHDLPAQVRGQARDLITRSAVLPLERVLRVGGHQLADDYARSNPCGAVEALGMAAEASWPGVLVQAASKPLKSWDYSALAAFLALPLPREAVRALPASVLSRVGDDAVAVLQLLQEELDTTPAWTAFHAISDDFPGSLGDLLDATRAVCA